MAGILDQAQMGALSQALAQQSPMVAPTVAPNFTYFPQGTDFGAGRFLTGNAPIPMEFTVPVPQYTPTAFEPGAFEAYLQADRGGKPMIYNTETNKYSNPKARSAE